MKLINGIIHENPIFVLMLGLCSSLAITTKVENAYLMGLCVFIVLLFSNIVISLIKKIVQNNVQIPVYILIIGTFVTILEIILGSYIPKLYEILGVYLPLIVVNCIVLGRALSVASKESVKNSVIDAVGISLGYLISLTLIALVREVLGSNTITLIDSLSSITGYKVVYKVIPNSNLFPMTFFTSPAGAFIALGILMAIFNYLKNRGKKDESN